MPRSERGPKKEGGGGGGGTGSGGGSGSGRQELREVAAGELKCQHTLQGPTRLGCQRDTFSTPFDSSTKSNTATTTEAPAKSVTMGGALGEKATL